MIPTFAKALMEEVMPQVEKNFHAAKDRNHRAIAGLSMGGAESIYTGLTYLDHFAYIGSFSGAFTMWPRANPAPPQPAGAGGGGRGPRTMQDADFEKLFPNVSAKTNSQLRLVWIACGSDDGLMAVNRQFRTWLKAKDVKFTELELGLCARVAAVAAESGRVSTLAVLRFG